MITSNDLKGIMTMMPAFTKKDGDRIDATDTVDTDELTRTVDKIITRRRLQCADHHRQLRRVSYALVGRA